ncbi:GntR family transcriptional regulator [Lysinibacillus piscis]|uniref:HTH-type transcriptional regulator FrlR n=1 Tax=Lysinibacillus piscis TaxID=2518931 RepID=A0ABQ5NP15_9BACI|nr:GntR family transcriptional regulator [Lysinibacillus sp. KH24]GLC90100.1 HTH-type transcriptional regulator FrlR [Lysinibacillus sp. KH24]
MNKLSDTKGSPTFLYEEVMAHIRELIKKQNLHAGARIPNEAELCDILDVSRITIRRAIKELIAEGVLEVVRGKGTFVKASKTQLHLLNLKGFTEGLSAEERNIQKTIISKKRVDNPEIGVKHFAGRYSEFIELVRKVYDGDGYLSLDYAYLPTELYPNIEGKIDDQTSTFRVMKTEYHVKFAKVKKEIEYTLPTLEICEHLEINKISPVVRVKKVIYNDQNEPVHYSNYYLTASRVKFYIEAEYTD